MFNEEALAYLVGLGKEQVVIEAQNGGEYTPNKMYRIEAPVAAEFTTHTLTSIVDYIKAHIDNLDETIIHIVSPTEVNVVSELNVDRKREHYLCAQAVIPNNLKFNSFMDTESFNIMLQSSFENQKAMVINEETGELEELDYKRMLLQVSGCIKEEAIKQVGDDGVSQAATIKTGVATVEPVKVPNPVQLAPYRTFQEIEQPVSKFIFRMSDGPRAALFEADGGMWKNLAVLRIKNFLESELKDIEKIHILA